MKKFNVVIGSKEYFSNQIKEVDITNAKYFLDLVKLSDSYQNLKAQFPDNLKADLLIVKNDNYHGITEQANDRIGALIDDLTNSNATILVHNPSSNLLNYLKSLKEANQIDLDINPQTYDIKRDKDNYSNAIEDINKNIIGQENAIIEISKSLLYLTSVKRKKPYVIMLYGSSSIGKTEMVREIALNFFDNHFLEQHLSMYKSIANGEYLFGDKPNRRSIGFDLLERESNLVFLDEIDKCSDYFYSVFYTLFDNTIFKDAVYEVDISGTLIILTSNYNSEEEIKEKLGLPIYYRIDKFIHFEDFSSETIFKITKKEIHDKYDEYKEYFSEEEIYNIVSGKILSNGENARTIKNKIQAEIEQLLFNKLFESKSKK